MQQEETRNKDHERIEQVSAVKHLPAFHPPLETLGDFTTNWRVIPISGLAIVIGLQDLRKARELSVEQELTRERVLRLRVPVSLRKVQ